MEGLEYLEDRLVLIFRTLAVILFIFIFSLSLSLSPFFFWGGGRGNYVAVGQTMSSLVRSASEFIIPWLR